MLRHEWSCLSANGSPYGENAGPGIATIPCIILLGIVSSDLYAPCRMIPLSQFYGILLE